MDRLVRRKLEMAVRVRAFYGAHPSADANHASVLGRLDETISRMELLVEQQVGGFLSKHSSTLRRRAIRRRLHGGMLRHLVTIARSAAEENPELMEKFRLPSSNASHKLFRTVARKMLEQGQAAKELLVKHGLSATLLDDLSAGIDEFDASVAETNGGKLDHVLARAELETLSDEVMRLVGMLDGINRYRFDRDPQLLVAWKVAKHVVSGPQAEAQLPPTPPPATDQAGTGEVKPGVLAARWGISALVAMVPDGLPSFGEVGLDRRALLFSFAITVGAGLVFGAVPARYGTRGQLADALQGRGADLLGGTGVRQLFVAVQLGLCIVLLVGAALLARSFGRLQQVPVGFNPDHLVTAELRLPVTKYANDTVVVEFGRQALERLRATPGVRSAALVDAVPLSGNWGMGSFRPEGRATPDSLLPTAQMNAVSDGFFATMEIPLVMGREFGPTDRLGAPMVAIVNRELARRTWPGESPLGKRITVTGPPDVELTVVSVAGNVKQLTLSGADEPQLYLAKAQSGGIFHSVAVRTAGDPDAMGDAVREAIWAVDRDQPVWKIRSMAALLDFDLAPRRFTARLTGGFALLALLLALIGVYGVMSYVVAQRTREIGVRMALGAARGEVVRLVLGRGLRIVAVGIGLGLAAAYAGARVIERQLFGVAAADVATFVAVPLVLLVVAAVACWVPARRAARVDPAIALSAE